VASLFNAPNMHPFKRQDVGPKVRGHVPMLTPEFEVKQNPLKG